MFSKLLDALNSEEIEGQKSKKESVQSAVQGLVRLLERGSANEVEKENMIGEVQQLVFFVCYSRSAVNVFLLLRLDYTGRCMALPATPALTVTAACACRATSK